jgi:hypothetical protein
MSYLRTVRSVWRQSRRLILGSLIATGLANHAIAEFVVLESDRCDTRLDHPNSRCVSHGARRRSRRGASPTLRPILTRARPIFSIRLRRGALSSTLQERGFLASANAGGSNPILFAFPSDFQTFSAQKLFTAANSNITDVNFFLPGTSTAATTSAFGLIFVDVEVAN